MYLSILNTKEMKLTNLLHMYVDDFDSSDLANKRPSQATRRAAALAIVRGVLVENQLVTDDVVKQITIKHHASGEPFLYFPKTMSSLSLHISISHSGTWIACLISSSEKPACIDLEDLSITRKYLKLAEHYFSEPEIDFVREQGPLGFYKLWTAKEAISKVQGKGLSQVLQTSLQITHGNVASEDYNLSQSLTNDYICTVAEKK